MEIENMIGRVVSSVYCVPSHLDTIYNGGGDAIQLHCVRLQGLLNLFPTSRHGTRATAKYQN